MTNEEILKKAIEKAERNGYKGHDYKYLQTLDDGWWDRDSYPTEDIKFYGVIFSHDFAKAFWGECNEWLYLLAGDVMDYVNELPRTCRIDEEYREVNGWKYHLQQMVLEEDPIKYLEKFI